MQPERRSFHFRLRVDLACARLYRGQDKIVFEGSYEITSTDQADVDALRKVSPRFVARWSISVCSS